MGCENATLTRQETPLPEAGLFEFFVAGLSASSRNHHLVFDML